MEQHVPDKTDRRKTLLVLTDKARGLEPDYRAVSEQMTEIFYAGFSNEEIVRCEEMLKRIYENLKRPKYTL